MLAPLVYALILRQRGARARASANGPTLIRGVAPEMQKRVLDALSEVSPDGIAIISETARVVFSNSRMKGMWGVAAPWRDCSIEQTLNRARDEVLDPVALATLLGQFVPGDGMPRRLELKMRDGRLLDSFVGPLAHGEGAGRGWVWFVRDITAFKRVTEELRLVAKQAPCILYEAVVKGMPGWQDDLEGKRRLFNWDIKVQDEFAAQRVLPLDVPPGSAYWSQWRQSRVAEDLPAMAATCAAAFIRGEINFAQDFRCVDKYGKTRWLHENVSIEPLEPGRWRTFGVCTDITALKRAEWARAQLAAIVESSSDAILGILPDGTISSCNAAAAQVFGYTVEELQHQPVTILCPEESKQDALWVVQQIARGEAGPRQFETERLRKDGGRIIVALSLSPIRDAAGQVIGCSEIARDITLHKRAEDALRESEERFHVFLENTPGLVFIKDDRGRMIYINEAACRAGGFESQAWRGKTTSELFSPEIARPLEDHDREVLECGEPRQVIEVIPSGESKHEYLVSKFPFRYNGGAGPWLGAVAIDLTEFRRTQQALEASEERFARFMRHLPGLAFIKDRDGRITFINDAHQRTIGWQKGEWSGKTCRELFPPGIAAVMEEHDRRVIEEGRPLQALEVIPQLDGEHVYLVSKFPIAERNAEELVLGGICVDVTEQQRAEKLVQFQKTMLELLIESSRDGILLVDSQGKWISFNSRFSEMWGITQDILDSRSDDQALQHVKGMLKDPDAFLSRVRELYDDRLARSHDRIEFKDGRVYERLSVPVHGPEFGRVWFFRDITEQERDKERLRSLTWEMTNSEERERRRIAATLHDHVGQMLVVLRMKVSSGVESADVPELKRLVDEISQAVRSLTVQLSPPVLYELGLTPALRWLASHLLPQHGIQYECMTESDIEVPDETRLTLFQSVRELLFNVIKHASAKHVEIRVWGESDQLHISVKDDGNGFDTSKAGVAVDENSFGLFSIRERLQYLGGRFLLESAPGCGTRAELTVPVASATVMENAPGGALR